jgi:hypothetical protein
LEKGRFTKHHDCGIGKTVNVPWRHVDGVGSRQTDSEARG